MSTTRWSIDVDEQPWEIKSDSRSDPRVTIKVEGQPKSSSPPTTRIFMQAQTSSQLYPSSSSTSSTIDFTKRKRWADLLITELTEAIILILSTRCQIIYCSAAVKDLLGWRDEDFIDTEFLDLVNGAQPAESFNPL